MNKRRNIYRGFNKRRKKKILRMALIAIPIMAIGTYISIKVKNSDISENIISKISPTKIVNSIDKNEFKSSKDLGIEQKHTKESNNEKVNDNDIKSEKDIAKEKEKQEVEDVKVAITDSWTIYTIQVASVDNEVDMNKISTELDENSIPFSIIEIDGVKKIQTYTSFNKEFLRANVDNVKKVFEDAFITEIKAPVLSMKYTSKYSYIDDVSKLLNQLVANFKEESNFWESNKDTLNKASYEKIILSRQDIVKDIQKEANKIDYSPAKIFKENLISYINRLDENVNESIKALKDNDDRKIRSLYLSSMQGYVTFIGAISKA